MFNMNIIKSLILMFLHICFCCCTDVQLPVTEPDINNRLESLCLSMTEHALGGKTQF